MTVQDLINELEKVEDKNLIVLLSQDEEGNGFKLLQGYEELRAHKDLYNYEVGYGELTEELEELGYTEEDVLCADDSFPALVLWP